MNQLATSDFTEITQLIVSARQRAVQAVNTALIDLYWQVGQIISRKIAAAEWGDAVVPQLASHLAQTQPGLRGFTARNLFRMRQFYEAYRDDEKVAPLARQLPWTHNLIILNQSKRQEEREFYLRLAIQEQWSSRDLERQLKTALFERTVLNPTKVSAVLSQMHPDTLSASFKKCVIPAWIAGIVRPRGQFINRVEVPVGVSHNAVAESNCVTAKWGGEQLEAKRQSVG